MTVSGERVPRPCPSCGATFAPRKVGGRWTKTCSEPCRRAAVARAMRNGGARRAAAARTPVPRVEVVCEVCGLRWSLPPSQAKCRRTCSIACAAELKRRDGGAHVRGRANPNHRNGSRVGVRDRAGERRWYAVLERACAACGSTDRLTLHHLVYRQHVDRAGGDVWDPRNALTLCASCHASHHRRGRVLALSLVPESARAFARDLLGAAADDYFRRYYSAADAGRYPAAWEVSG